MGLCAALALAERGLAVTICERAGAGAESSGAAAGMLAPQHEAEGPGPFLDFGLAARTRHAALAARLADAGLDDGYWRCGGLEVAFDGRELRALGQRARWQRLAGLSLQLLDADGVARIAPALRPAAGGLWFPDEAQVEPRRWLPSVLELGRRAGVRWRDAEATSIAVDGGAVVGVDTAAGRLSCGVAVVASGAWSSLLGGLGLARDAVVPVRGQFVEYESPGTLATIVFGGGGYATPRRSGRVVVGSTMERVGYDKSTSDAGLAHLRGVADRLSPRLASSPETGRWAGLRPGTADGLPLLGAIPTARGLYVAAGHLRNGILLAPSSGDVLAALIAGGELPAAARAFDPARLF